MTARQRRFILSFFFMIVSVGSSVSVFAGTGNWDTLKVMSYNTLNYGFPATGACPALLTSLKHQYLQTILQAEDPDVLGLVKMTATPSSFSTDSIPQFVLDVVCPGCYDHTPFTNVSGYTKEDMLYFKTTKLGYVSTTTIYSGDPNISDINLHRLFYKDTNLALTLDTVFLNIILVHLKSGANNGNDRATEIAGVTIWLNTHVTAPGNYLLMGDMNTTSSNENCFQYLINSGNTNAKFYDPPNQLGDWSANSSAFANYLTQSTRVVDPGDCGAVGSLTDRLDHILCTQPVLLGLQKVQYVANSFKVIGQDGNHTGIGLLDPPANTSVPSAELNALYYMSNHLPVSLKLALKKSSLASVQQPSVSADEITYNSSVVDKLEITQKPLSLELGLKCSIYSADGKKVMQVHLADAVANVIPVEVLPEGVYIFKLSNESYSSRGYTFVKH
jgi:hypothetical protein